MRPAADLVSCSNTRRRSSYLPEKLDIRPLDAPVGAEVRGLDLRTGLEPATVSALHRALLLHQVLILPDQRLDDEQHLSFSRHWGKLQVHVLDQYHHSGRPELLWITNLDADGRPKRGER